jgi:hypothetical protein
MRKTLVISSMRCGAGVEQISEVHRTYRRKDEHVLSARALRFSTVRLDLDRAPWEIAAVDNTGLDVCFEWTVYQHVSPRSRWLVVRSVPFQNVWRDFGFGEIGYRTVARSKSKRTFSLSAIQFLPKTDLHPPRSGSTYQSLRYRFWGENRPIAPGDSGPYCQQSLVRGKIKPNRRYAAVVEVASRAPWTNGTDENGGISPSANGACQNSIPERGIRRLANHRNLPHGCLKHQE